MDPFFDPPASTFEPTKKEPNVGNINTIPGEDIFYMDCRVLPDYNLEDVITAIKEIAKKIEKKFKVKIEISPVHCLQSPPSTAPDAPVVLALREAVNLVFAKSKSRGIGAGTLTAYLRKKNYPVAVWSKNNQKAHQPDESCSIDNMWASPKFSPVYSLQSNMIVHLYICVYNHILNHTINVLQ